mmetsp:Transcript_5331/g.10195  ORF Transcript_5331/g.10195 Transcript_5331/m.10195 type:complete len:100 (+) Transcript_5331:119-418(+)
MCSDLGTGSRICAFYSFTGILFTVSVCCFVRLAGSDPPMVSPPSWAFSDGDGPERERAESGEVFSTEESVLVLRGVGPAGGRPGTSVGWRAETQGICSI